MWWSMSTMLTPFAVHLGLPWLLACRACMGIGEGVAMPAMNQIVSRWIPVQERSRSLSLIYSGMYMGSVFGLLLSPPMIRNFGWPSVFVGFGILGVIWMYYWARQVQSSPQVSKLLKRTRFDKDLCKCHIWEYLKLFGRKTHRSQLKNATTLLLKHVTEMIPVPAKSRGEKYFLVHQFGQSSFHIFVTTGGHSFYWRGCLPIILKLWDLVYLNQVEHLK